MQKRIILFTIGSIQEFIMHSKKIKDLHNSSKLMIELIKLGMNIIKEQNGEIILPVTLENSSDSIPNYFIADYKLEESIGPLIEKRIKEYFVSILRNSNIGLDAQIIEEFKASLHENLDIYWVEHFYEDGDDYLHIYRKLYKYIEGIKRIKHIGKVQNPNEKCTMCGIRNPIVAKTKSCVRYVKAKYQTLISSYKGIDDKEMLCGMCLCKRVFSSEKIPSLARIAQLRWANKEVNKEKYQMLANAFDRLKTNKDFAETLYEEKWKVFCNENNKIDENLRHDIEKLRNQVIPNFYCLYRFDIDDLGMHMHKYKKCEQLALSECINHFYTAIREKFNDSCFGKLIYAGGDDLLAIIPVENVFLLLDMIDNAFKEYVGDGITYSQSVHIVHYTMPLREVIRYSKSELDQVKSRYSTKYNDNEIVKNGTVISIFTAGYNSQSVFFRNTVGDVIGYRFLMKCLGYFKHNSSYFHYTLEREFRGMTSLEKYDIRTTDILQILFIEQERLIRKYAIDGEKVEHIHTKLKDFFYTSCMMGNQIDIENYYNWFHIIRKLNSLVGERGFSIEYIQ